MIDATATAKGDRARRFSSRQLRRGTTLIEMSSVIILMSMLMLLSVRALSAAGKLQEMSVATMTDTRLWQHAESRLRDDLARARVASSGDGGQQFILQIDAGRSIRYSASGARKIIREVIEPNELGQSRVVGRDALLFATPVDLRIELLSPQLVRVSFDSASRRQIVAILGVNRLKPNDE